MQPTSLEELGYTLAHTAQATVDFLIRSNNVRRYKDVSNLTTNLFAKAGDTLSTPTQ